jgi:CDP-diglyceride synthetase
MKHFLLGIGTFALISLLVFAFAELLTSLSLTEETIQVIFMVVVLTIIAKPFGELTASVFKLNK